MMSTNAILSRGQAEWITNNIRRVQVSYDGTAQDIQRPFPNGRPSSYLVKRSMKTFSELGLAFHVRLTATNNNIFDLESIAQEVMAYKGKHRLSIEPVGHCFAGREFNHKDLAVRPQDFVDMLIHLKNLYFILLIKVLTK